MLDFFVLFFIVWRFNDALCHFHKENKAIKEMGTQRKQTLRQQRGSGEARAEVRPSPSTELVSKTLPAPLRKESCLVDSCN